ncbi:hypothetical protein B0T26DRAFT_676962 [Lasiosphaeria miniovina]|uniref:Uncharacterized protein n=1 Tax=Lasiosphaeria miniovina TaxID=1954250 RepID=A0AA40AB14_9PEZI|nr:uncharacterized protein B0T26DRAFT_676962 [Lasiosphaeria miniovina]KAK0712509.1 hypothetical protein B0T26DRAFT_676962 [Lasiosphaeria miniovina]
MDMDALRFASDGTVRAILIALCNNPANWATAQRYLGHLEPNALRVAELPGTKRKAKWGASIYGECDNVFDEADNRKVNGCWASDEKEDDKDEDEDEDEDE